MSLPWQAGSGGVPGLPGDVLLPTAVLARRGEIQWSIAPHLLPEHNAYSYLVWGGTA